MNSLETQDMNMSLISVEKDLKPAEGFMYNFRKWLAVVIAAISYVFVYFHRFTTAVLADDMAKDLGVPKTSLGILSSMYFWPYGLMQPFIGSFSDILEPGMMIGLSNILSAGGSLLCGLSSNLGLACVGRFIVGFGCSGIFVPTTKIASNWFSAKAFRIFSGSLIAIGGCGSILSQAPLSMLGHAIGWRWCLNGVAIISVVVGTLSFIFVRGHPRKLGYYSPIPLQEKTPFKTTVIQLFRNLKEVVINIDFWILQIFMFLGPGVFTDASAMWGIPYLQDVHGISADAASFIAMTLSASIIVGSPTLPMLGEKFGRKRVITIAAILSLVCTLVLTFAKKLHVVLIIILFFFFGVGATASQGVILAIFKEYCDLSLSGTFVGCGNCGPFVGGAVYQMISSGIIGTYGSYKHYPFEAYQVGMWGLSAVSMVVGILALILSREPTAN
ncbi:major facilitator superfamily transporter [Histomonas meleagridis]|uniref:major facilitator superfamily transporter n=1 Tax=Histomonas meleagridis TaxID=135588 RepID=UPI0035597539|nr:major facilitator superfamily transporter [Histomonas meleagridis]KAH0797271.1 major facilitator superfamily transporter [Histomonas meleagridis]